MWEGAGRSQRWRKAAKAKAGAEAKAAAEARESAKVIEKAVREELDKPTGELTKADLEKVTRLFLYGNKLTDVTALEKFTQLKVLSLADNQLAKVPKGLENLTQLEMLTLNDNQQT